MRIAVVVLTVLALGLLVGVGETPTAEAAHNTFILPYDIGRNWRVCQGYETSPTHQNVYALDLTTASASQDPCTGTVTGGQRVRAPFRGVVREWDSTYGSLCIQSLGDTASTDYWFRLVHIDKKSGIDVGDTVARGTTVGYVHEGNGRRNNGVEHLHIELHGGANADNDCYDTSDDVPFTSATALSGINLPAGGDYEGDTLKRRPVTVCDNVGCPSSAPWFDLPFPSNCTDSACSKNYPDLAQVELRGIRWGDRIHGVAVRRGCTATLYRDPNYGGPSLTLTSSDLDLRNNPLGSGNWGDNASSIKTACK